MVSPDLISASMEVAVDTLSVNVRFAPGTRTGNAWITLYFDTDQNPSTGEGITPGGDYRAETFTGAGFVGITRYQNAGFSLITDQVPLNISADGMDFRIPLSMIGNGSGRMTFRFAVQTSLPTFGPGTSTPVLDWMPDLGKSPATVQ
jgi:hypothetical protein